MDYNTVDLTVLKLNRNIKKIMDTIELPLNQIVLEFMSKSF